MNRKPRKRIGYNSSSVRGLHNQSNASLDDKFENERIRSNSGKSVISPISTASTKGHQKKNSTVTNNKYKKYVYDRKYAEKPSSSKELKDKHNFANKESGYVNNFKKSDLDIEMKKERIKMLNLNLKGNYGQKFSMKKI